MTIRNIVNDIREHAADMLAECHLKPMVRFAEGESINDSIVFQSRGGKEHLVRVALRAGLGDDAWQRAVIVPLTVREAQLPGTDWMLVHADNVVLDDVAFLSDLKTTEERVALIVEHIVAMGDKYVPQDDLALQICTDKRLEDVVDKLHEVAGMTDGGYSVSVEGCETVAGDAIVNAASLHMLDGRTIEVSLQSETIEISLLAYNESRSFTVSSMSVFGKAMDEVKSILAEQTPSMNY